MKKTLAIIALVVLCLSLCACGNNKYVGTYQREISYLSGPEGVGVLAKEVMELAESGKGTFHVICTKDNDLFPAETVLVEGNITWVETDENITIKKSEVTFVREDDIFDFDRIFYVDGNGETLITETFTLSENKLTDTNNSRNTWNKMQ